MIESLEGRNAIVCGASRGIGQACALELARRGAAVTVVARNETALAETVKQLATDHGQAHRFLSMDFTDWRLVHECAQEHAAEHGPVHILINNSGGPPAGPAHEADIGAYLDGMTRHLFCSQVLVRALIPGMKEESYGRVINIISTSVITPIKGLGVSNTVRGAVANWAKTIASELGQFGITVNNVLPGFTGTQRLAELFEGKAKRLGKTVDEVNNAALATIPAGRLGKPEEIAAVVGFLASPAAAYVNGVNLPVDGGRLAAS